MTDAGASADGATRMGAKAEQVVPATPAAEAGIETGDVIVGIDDHIVGSAESLTGFVRQYRSGDEVKITLIRGESETTSPRRSRPSRKRAARRGRAPSASGRTSPRPRPTPPPGGNRP